jgi:hypothetical protein
MVDRALRRIFGAKREKVTEHWREKRNEELHNFCSSPNVVRVMEPRRM